MGIMRKWGVIENWEIWVNGNFTIINLNLIFIPNTNIFPILMNKL